MSSRTIAVSTLWQIASQIVMALLSTLSVKFVAIGLSQELAGTYNSSYGYLQLFAILADFGLYAVSVREVSGSKHPEKVLGALIVLRSIIATASLALAVGIAWIIPSWSTGPLRLGITIAAFVPFFTLLAGVLRTVFQVQFKMHLVFVAEVVQRIVSTGLMAGIILGGIRLSDSTAVFSHFLWAGVLGAAVLLAFSMFFSMRLTVLRPCTDPALLLSLLRKALPYGVAFLCIALYRQFDLTMIALLRDDYKIQNAMYGFAGRIAEMTYLVPTFLLNSTLPLLAGRHDRGENTSILLGKTLFLILTLGSISSIFAFLWGRPIMQLLTTSEYLSMGNVAGADSALSMLSMPMFLNGIVLFSFYTLLTRHAWKALVQRMLAGVILSIGLNLYLIPLYGFTGAIWTTTIVHVFLAATLLPIALRTLPTSFPFSYLWRWMLLSIVTACLASLALPYLQDALSIVIGLFLAMAFVPLMAFLLGFQALLERRWNMTSELQNVE